MYKDSEDHESQLGRMIISMVDYANKIASVRGITEEQVRKEFINNVVAKKIRVNH